MPMEFLDRLPVPNLRVYTTVSFGVLSCSVYYAAQIIKDPAWKSNHTYVETGADTVTGDIDSDPRNLVMHFKELITCMLDEPICIWTLINMAYCVLILLGKTIQKLVFGELRASERQHLKDKFWNFVFYKFIFVFGVLNVQYMDEVVLWWAWFTALGFLSLLSQLCKDRFEYVFSCTGSSKIMGQTEPCKFLVAKEIEKSFTIFKSDALLSGGTSSTSLGVRFPARAI